MMMNDSLADMKYENDSCSTVGLHRCFSLSLGQSCIVTSDVRLRVYKEFCLLWSISSRVDIMYSLFLGFLQIVGILKMGNRKQS